MKRALLFVLALSATANAGIDPSRAEEQVKVARAQKEDAFCTDPNTPILGRPRALCDHARAVEHCEALAKACDLDVAPKEPPIPAWLAHLAQGMVQLLVVLFVVVVLILVAIAIFSIRRNRRKSEDRPARVEEEERAPAPVFDPSGARALLERARSLERSNPEESLALYLRASLRALDERGVLEIADDRTNGEYVREVSDATTKSTLRTVVRELERVRFGRMLPSAEGIERAAKAAAAIVLATMLLACDAVKRVQHGPKGDPSETTMLARVLTDQGLHVVSAGSLARMPLPSEDDYDPPTVLVDLQTTDVSDEARAHLGAWVRAGGKLVIAGAVPEEIVPHVDPTLADNTDVTVQGLKEHGTITTPEGYSTKEPCAVIARVGKDTPYALLCGVDRGTVLAMASDDFIANVGFVRDQNAKLSLEMLAHVASNEVRIAGPLDGADSPDSPLASLERAGLTNGLAHALVFTLILFFAVGIRLGRPKPIAPPTRRAFAEHVEATGALYARARAAKHALAQLVRFVEERIRGDVPIGLAHRSGLPIEVCTGAWTDARAPREGDEIRALRELHRVLERTRLR